MWVHTSWNSQKPDSLRIYQATCSSHTAEQKWSSMGWLIRRQRTDIVIFWTRFQSAGRFGLIALTPQRRHGSLLFHAHVGNFPSERKCQVGVLRRSVINWCTSPWEMWVLCNLTTEQSCESVSAWHDRYLERPKKIFKKKITEIIH